MQPEIKKLANSVKNLIRDDIENSMELMGLNTKEDKFHIPELISKENFETLILSIKNKKDFDQILNKITFNYYNSIFGLKIMQEKLLLDEKYISLNTTKNNSEEPYLNSFYSAIENASKKTNFFKHLIKNLIIKLNDETFKEIYFLLEKHNFWMQDDLMGWLYQFYNSSKDNMLSKSQIFTPDWVVKYMVDKSFQLLDNPLESKILDPACGSGNFLIYIYDKLKSMYLKNGYTKKEAIKNIIEKNLHGIDIDQRAIQIAKFLLNLKILEDKITLDLKFNLSTPDPNNKKAMSMGSLYNLSIEDKNHKFYDLLNKKYDFIIANPPYTDSSEYNKNLKNYIKESYEPYKKNLYSCFISKNEELLNKNGVISMITPQTFMYISSYEDTRNLILNKLNIERFVHFGLGGVFDYALVDTALYVLTKKEVKESVFIDLTKINKKHSKKNYLINIKDNSENIYKINQEIFKKIPGSKFVYWLKKSFYKIFKEKQLENFCDIRQGIASGNNKKFLRFHWEIPYENINFNGEISNIRWIPYVKGGPHRRWFGNYYWLISYDKKSKSQLQKIGNHLPSKQYYFKEGITYTMTTSKGSTFRYLPKNMMFDCKGSSIFPKNKNDVFFFLGLLNSKLTTYIIRFLAGSVDLEVGDLKALPLPDLNRKNNFKQQISEQSKKIYELKKENMEIFPEELYHKSFIENLEGNTFEDIFNNFIKEKIKKDYQILIEESIMNDLVLKFYDLEKEKNIIKKEFKDYIDIEKDSKKMKLNYDIKKLKTKINENIARKLALDGYNINDIMNKIENIDFTKNKNLVKQFIFLITNEIIKNISNNDEIVILENNNNLISILEKYHIDSFTTSDYHKNNINYYIKEIFPKEHYKYFKKTPYLIFFKENSTNFEIILDITKINKLSIKRIITYIEDKIIDLYEKNEDENKIDNLKKYKEEILLLYDNYEIDKTYEQSNYFFEYFKSVLYF